VQRDVILEYCKGEDAMGDPLWRKVEELGENDRFYYWQNDIMRILGIPEEI